MVDTADSDPAPVSRPRPLHRRRRILGALLTLTCAAGVGLAASAALLAWGEHDEALIWLSLMADAAVVILAAEVGLRALRQRGNENDLDKTVSQHYASLTVDQEGTILTWSDEAEGLTGYSAEQTIGNTFSFLLTPVTADIGLQAQL